MGKSTVELLACVGCSVAIADIVQERAEHVAVAISKLGQRSASIIGDVLDDAQTEDIVKRAERELGGLDMPVTTVGQA